MAREPDFMQVFTSAQARYDVETQSHQRLTEERTKTQHAARTAATLLSEAGVPPQDYPNVKVDDGNRTQEDRVTFTGWEVNKGSIRDVLDPSLVLGGDGRLFTPIVRFEDRARRDVVYDPRPGYAEQYEYVRYEEQVLDSMRPYGLLIESYIDNNHYRRNGQGGLIPLTTEQRSEYEYNARLQFELKAQRLLGSYVVQHGVAF